VCACAARGVQQPVPIEWPCIGNPLAVLWEAAKAPAPPGGGLDLNTDVAGLFEIKWISTEFDLTRKDSLLPFIPILTVARAGGQPFATIANYKVYYANGDFAGVDLYSTFTLDIKNHLA
jgi:hypothetical protein